MHFGARVLRWRYPGRICGISIMQNNPNNPGNRPPYPIPIQCQCRLIIQTPNSLPPMPHFLPNHTNHTISPPPPFANLVSQFSSSNSIHSTSRTSSDSEWIDFSRCQSKVGQPNRTLYLQNLPKGPIPTNTSRPPQRSFQRFGPLKRPPILRKGTAMNGQAWIIISRRKLQSDADAAVKALQGTRIWGKSLVIRYARFRSDCVILETRRSRTRMPLKLKGN